MELAQIETSPSRLKDNIVADIHTVINELGYKIVDENTDKPWGAYFRFAPENTSDFIGKFFENSKFPDWSQNQELSPKFLLVAPEKRLSWQYHARRGELWRVIRGPIIVYLSDNDTLPKNPVQLQTGNHIEIGKSIRHRLAGNHTWGIVAEIWVHTEKDNPSSEEDIVRLEDDFGRT